MLVAAGIGGLGLTSARLCHEPQPACKVLALLLSTALSCALADPGDPIGLLFFFWAGTTILLVHLFIGLWGTRGTVSS